MSLDLVSSPSEPLFSIITLAFSLLDLLPLLLEFVEFSGEFVALIK